MRSSSSIIYTVQTGDTLYNIARRFNTTIEDIMKLNGLTSTELIPGQRLKIPLYTEVIVNVDVANIRKGPGTYYPIIAQMNRNARLPEVGAWKDWKKVKLFDNNKGWIRKDLVKVYIHDGERPIIGNLGFYTLEEGPTLPSSYDSFVKNTFAISETGLFLFQINKNNPTEIVKFGDFTDEYVKDIVSIAHRQNIKALPVVHNLLYKDGGTKTSKDVVKTLVSNKQNRQAFIQNVIKLIEKYDFDGVNIDIEDVYLEDSKNLSALYTELGEALRKKGYYLSGSIPARVSDEPFNPFSDPFDYEIIGKAVDEFVVMLYNEHGWPGSGPGPVVSIGWMDRVLNYAKSKMMAEKIVGAVSVFGFDFNLTTGKNTYVTYDMAMKLADKYNKEIIFDEKTQTPTFAYVDEQGNQHEVWFENKDSIYEKAKKVWELGVKGLALWRLGMEDPNMWPMLKEDVVIKK
ncbi:glycosyl hydrolase family 18 protein [Crassaminicella indica]|uniref:LysM peptidoglycan-binding domain-containing protein n=1 Tax=Crassaminicella indica TaxID=2855394 RepID=A0ABX8R8Q6_9CLOT|nr:glycosyl hydrolase family 18 protein [Crassaminicella indica]QXM05403.1 LysM peptidoglycan-binding domain-containing protein [Crassaminicella indica]